MNGLEQEQQTHNLIEELDRRLTRVERQLGLVEREIDAPDQVAGKTSTPFQWGSVALVCFVMIGALLLRFVTRQGGISLQVGTGIGLAYSLLLLGSYRLERRVGRSVALVLQACGCVLAPAIVLETVHRGQVMSITMAACTLGGFAVVAAILSLVQRSGAVAGIALGLLAPAIVALGPQVTGGPWRAGVLAGACGLALLLAHKLSHDWLRPLVVLPVQVVLGVAMVMTARRTGILPSLPLSLGVCSLVVGVLVATSSVLHSGGGGRFERLLFILTPLWAYGLWAFWVPGLAVPVAAGVASLSLVATAAYRPFREADGSLASSCVVAATLLASLSLPWLERSGVALAGAALLVQWIGQRRGGRLERLLAHLLVWEGALLALVVGGLLVSAPQAGVAAPVALGVVFSAKGVFVYLRARPRQLRASWCGVVTLTASVVVLFFALRLLAGSLLPDRSVHLLAQSVLLGAFAVCGQVVGRQQGHRPVAILGLAALVVLVLKLLLWDLVRLEGVYVIGAVLTLGLAALFTSLLRGGGRQEHELDTTE